LADVPPDENTSEAEVKGKKTGCFGWLFRIGLVGLLLLVGALLWLNGPGFRWLAHKYGPGFFTEAGFENEFKISGTLWKGPVIEELSLSSTTSPLKSLQAEGLTLNYHPLRLKEMIVDGISADSNPRRRNQPLN